MVERIIVFMLSLLGQFEAVAFVMAAKGLIVQSLTGPPPAEVPLQTNLPQRAPSPTEIKRQEEADLRREVRQETYLLGSFVSFAIAIVGGTILGDCLPRSKAEPPTAPAPVPSAPVIDDSPKRIDPKLADAPNSHLLNTEPAKAAPGSLQDEQVGATKPRKIDLMKPTQTRNAIPVLMDVDTGVDDALSIMLALHAPDHIKLLGITTTSGNASNEQAALNTYFLLSQYGLEEAIPITVGADSPLSGRPGISVKKVHGEDGLGGASAAYFAALPGDERSRVLQRRDATEVILEAARTHGKNLVIVATAPLTNIAAAIRRDPQVMAGVGRIKIMGGAFGSKDEAGNITPYAEFNIHSDPEAARIVVASGIPVTIFPLDVTHRVHLLADKLNSSLDLGPGELALIKAITSTYFAFHHGRYGFTGSFMHDVSPVVSLLDPGLFTYRTGDVLVETQAPEREGQTRWAMPGEPGSRAEVAQQVEPERLLDAFWNQLRRPTVTCKFRPPTAATGSGAVAP